MSVHSKSGHARVEKLIFILIVLSFIVFFNFNINGKILQVNIIFNKVNDTDTANKLGFKNTA